MREKKFKEYLFSKLKLQAFMLIDYFKVAIILNIARI